MGEILSGRKVADDMQAAMQEKVANMEVKPGLVVIIVGENPASQTYVRNKEKTASKLGIRSTIERLPETVTEEALIALIESYNNHPDYHGILVQLPLPAHINEETVLLAIDPEKDVDGFHPFNVGKLMTGDPTMLPCTPYGIIKMLEAYDVPLAGRHAVIVGRSNIVGKPMLHLLLEKDATVTITHSRTTDLAQMTKQADILIVAVGKGHLIDQSYVKPGAVVIDVGMNRNAEGKLIGDVDFADVQEVASLITPVPGGVGPMTITMLMDQTIRNAERLG